MSFRRPSGAAAKGLGGPQAHASPPGRTARKVPTSRSLGPGAIRSTACASRPATVQASVASVDAAGGRRTLGAIGTPPVPTLTETPVAATPADDMQPANRCSRRATTAASRAATLPPHGPGPTVRRRHTDQTLAPRQAEDRFAVTRPGLASRRQCTRRASSLPGTPARADGQDRDHRTGASPTAGFPVRPAATAASLTRRGDNLRTLTRGITTIPLPIPAIRCWRLAIRRQTSLRRRPGGPSVTAGRREPGQLLPGLELVLAASLAAREGHPDGMAPRLGPLGPAR